MTEEIFAFAWDSETKVGFVWGLGTTQSARESDATTRAVEAVGETPSIMQSAYDSWGWTEVPDLTTGDDYEVVEGVIQAKA